MSGFRLAAAATHDLSVIHAYISQRNAAAADQLSGPIHRLHGEGVDNVRVLHGARDYESLF